MSVILTPEELKARRRRNLWIALAIAAFVVLVFAITLAQMHAAALERTL
jgi:cytoskeletal protein RodZ